MVSLLNWIRIPFLNMLTEMQTDVQQIWSTPGSANYWQRTKCLHAFGGKTDVVNFRGVWVKKTRHDKTRLTGRYFSVKMLVVLFLRGILNTNHNKSSIIFLIILKWKYCNFFFPPLPKPEKNWISFQSCSLWPSRKNIPHDFTKCCL